MAFLTDTRTAGLSLTQRFAEFRARLADAAAKRKIYRTTLSELDGLSDRELTDLGLSRSGLRRIAHEAAYGN